MTKDDTPYLISVCQSYLKKVPFSPWLSAMSILHGIPTFFAKCHINGTVKIPYPNPTLVISSIEAGFFLFTCKKHTTIAHQPIK